MKNKIFIILLINLLFSGAFLKTVFALEHVQKNGLFSMDVPEGWHWAEASEEVGITYPDGKTIAIDIQWAPSRDLSQADIKRTIKQANDKMIKDGIQAHQGALISDKEFKLNGLYATQLDFNTSPPTPIHVTYISFINKGYAFTVTYGSEDEKMHSVMDDVFATLKF
jgi:hypothetical protein